MSWFKTLFTKSNESNQDSTVAMKAHTLKMRCEQLGFKSDIAKTLFEFIDTESESILIRKEKMFAKLEHPDFEIRVANQVEQFAIWFQDLRVPRYKHFKYAIINKDSEIEIVDCEFHNKPLAMYVKIESEKVKTPRKMVATAWSGIGVWEKPSEFTEIESSWRTEYDTQSAFNELKEHIKQYIQDIEAHINRNTIFINSVK